jgi:hypothetical protein
MFFLVLLVLRGNIDVVYLDTKVDKFHSYVVRIVLGCLCSSKIIGDICSHSML